MRYLIFIHFFFVGAQNIGVNPKVNNMINAYDQAQYPLFLISDAGIRSEYYAYILNI